MGKASITAVQKMNEEKRSPTTANLVWESNRGG